MIHAALVDVMESAIVVSANNFHSSNASCSTVTVRSMSSLSFGVLIAAVSDSAWAADSSA